MPCYVVSATRQTLDPDPLDASQVVSGNPQVSTYELLDSDALAVGIWQHTAGVSTDVEVEEIFVVLSGRATIEVAGGPTLEVGPGDVGVLEAGAQTTWTIHEDLRKIYIIRP
ncbi:MAG TPA: cupin domain-containing protein [Actinomycetes bacterium]|nr:cupin domain-containing protein [Actinomycetes bacterium]